MPTNKEVIMKELSQLFVVEDVIVEMERAAPQSQRGSKRNYREIADRYVKLVMLHSHPIEGPGNLVSLPIYNIKRQLGKFQINGKETYWLHWFEQQTFSLYQRVEDGDNLSRKVSIVKMNFKMVSGNEILSWDNEEARTMLATAYPTSTNINAIAWTTPVDCDSLSNYITSTQTALSAGYVTRADGSTENVKPRLRQVMERNLKKAASIIKSVDDDGNLHQLGENSEFGRFYLKGLNLQATSKIVRHAALGKCYNVDIVAATYAWRLIKVHEILKSRYIAPYPAFAQTKRLLTNRTQFRQYFADLLQMEMWDVKELITAIGFGATLTTHAWPTGNGTYELPALSEILSRGTKLTREERIKLLDNDIDFQEFIAEQTVIADIIIDDYKLSTPKESYPRGVVDKVGRLSKNKLMAYLYQQHERNWMNQIVDYLTNKGIDILLTVHDGIYCRQRPNLPELSSVIVDTSGRMVNLKIEVEEITPYTFHDRSFEQRHREHMKMEKQQADEYWANKQTFVSRQREAFKVLDNIANGNISIEEQNPAGQTYIQDIVNEYFESWERQRQHRDIGNEIKSVTRPQWQGYDHWELQSRQHQLHELSKGKKPATGTYDG